MSYIYFTIALLLFILSSLVAFRLKTLSGYLMSVAALFILVGIFNSSSGVLLTSLFPVPFLVDGLNFLYILIFGIITFFLGLYVSYYREIPRVCLVSLPLAQLSLFLGFITTDPERVVLFYETFFFSTILMVIPTSLKSSRKYALYLQLYGVVPLLLALGLKGSGVPHYLLSFLYLLAILSRSGVFPFHGWVPEVYHRVPSPLLVSFVLGDAFGVYLLLRHSSLLTTLAVPLVILATITMFSTLYAFREVRLKRKFAYHGIMDTGVALFSIALGLLTNLKLLILIGLLHSLFSVLYRSAVFLSFGAVEHHGEDPALCSIRSVLKGPLAKLLPLAVLSMAGLPPLAGFITRSILYSLSLSSNPYILLLLLIVVVLGIFPMASVVQMIRFTRVVCSREKRVITPVGIRFVGMISLILALVLPYPLTWFLLGGVRIPFFRLLVGFGLLGLALVGGFRIGIMPSENVSEILLIFYNIGDILQDTAYFFKHLFREFYLRKVVPAIKRVPKHELAVVEKVEDVMDYETRHLDEVMFMPLIRAVERLARWGISRNPNMNELISGFVIALALLVVLLGVIGG